MESVDVMLEGVKRSRGDGHFETLWAQPVLLRYVRKRAIVQHVCMLFSNFHVTLPPSNSNHGLFIILIIKMIFSQYFGGRHVFSMERLI